ncbi:MAG: efflux RND transporter periplasmic adaptor subunit [Pseudomonadota bacterium]
MRIVSVVIAIIVASALYFLVFERDRLLSFASRGDDPAAVESEAAVPGVEAENETAERVVSVVALKSTAREIDSTVLLRGRTEAARQIDVRAETSGLVVSDPLRKGAYVDAGQLLCAIDPGTRETALAEAQARVPEAAARIPEAKGRLAEAESRLEEARINDNAAQQLSKDGFASTTRVASTRAALSAAEAAVESAKAGLQAAEAGVKSAQAAVASAEKEIERLNVLAPFSGLLETDTAELGALLQPGSACATIIQLDPIKLVGFVPETDVAKISVGSQAGARLISGREVLGEVTFVSRSSDMETRTFRVEVAVPNPDLAIRDGQTAEILIASEGTKAHLLPASAMTLNDAGELGVRLAINDAATFAPVRILRDTVEGVWLDGLPSEANVIVRGQEYVIDGVTIDVTWQEAAG